MCLVFVKKVLGKKYTQSGCYSIGHRNELMVNVNFIAYVILSRFLCGENSISHLTSSSSILLRHQYIIHLTVSILMITSSEFGIPVELDVKYAPCRLIRQKCSRSRYSATHCLIHLGEQRLIIQTSHPKQSYDQTSNSRFRNILVT